mgnify:CR=1 FL=1
MFGPDNWVFTGSAAVAIYANKYSPKELENLDEPGDLDILVKSKSLLTIPKIGDYKKVQDTLERSMTFSNPSSGESIDVATVPSIRKIVVDGFPLCDISLLLKEYNDVLSGNREKDIKKIRVLEKIKDLVERPQVEEERDFSHLAGIRKGPLF